MKLRVNTSPSLSMCRCTIQRSPFADRKEYVRILSMAGWPHPTSQRYFRKLNWCPSFHRPRSSFGCCRYKRYNQASDCLIPASWPDRCRCPRKPRWCMLPSRSRCKSHSQNRYCRNWRWRGGCNFQTPPRSPKPCTWGPRGLLRRQILRMSVPRT